MHCFYGITKDVDSEQTFLDKLKQTVEENIGDTELNVERLSSLMAMDRTVLYRKMQQLTGVAPSVYLREVRLQKASSLLLSKQNISVSDVAYRTGFSDPKYFSRIFKERYGVTPSEYRRGI